MKPAYDSTGQIEKAKTWYDELDYTEKRKVNKMIGNVQRYIKSRSITQFSKNMGIELVYSVKERLEI